METNTGAIVRLGWARSLGLPDDALDPGGDPARTLHVEAPDRVMVLRLWDRHVVVGPDWLQQRARAVPPRQLEDESVLLRCCEGRPARSAGQRVLAFTDSYVETEGLDDVAEVGLAALGRVFVTLDDREQPTAGAGYDEWQGILGHLGVLTPPEHRRAGHGTVAAALALNDALDVGLVPQWRARTENLASRRLARRLGFTEVGALTTVVLT